MSEGSPSAPSAWSLGFLRRPQNLTKSSLSIWRYAVSVKWTVRILSIFVAFLENMNFNKMTLCLNHNHTKKLSWMLQIPHFSHYYFKCKIQLLFKTKARIIIHSVRFKNEIMAKYGIFWKRTSYERCIQKMQQTKMLVTCQSFGDLFLFGLVWQYSSNHKTYNKGRFKVIAT